MASMARVTDQDVVNSHLDEEERIRLRAYEIYQARGQAPGHELEDWLEAEREILGGGTTSETQGRATTVGYAGRPADVGELGEA